MQEKKYKFVSEKGVEISIPEINSLPVDVLADIESLSDNVKIRDILNIFKEMLSSHEYSKVSKLSGSEFATLVNGWENFNKLEPVNLGE
jgi:hypothetical protein